MEDDDQLAKEEERLLRTLNARKRGVTSGVVGKSASNAANATANVTTSKQNAAPSVRPVPERDTQIRKAPSKTQLVNPPTHSNVLDDLLRKKSAVVSSINSGRRDLDELTNKIEHLLAEKARLTDLQEKRQHSLQELVKQIEEHEKKTDEDKAEEEKRRKEEQSKREEEDERRRKEEMERWNREREDKLEQERRKREQDSSWKVENRETSTPMFDVTHEKSASLASAPIHHSHQVHEDDEEEGQDQEAARIMRAMNKKRGAPVAVEKPKKVETAESTVKKAPSTQRDPKWVEAEAKREEERRRRAAELEAHKKREEEERRKEEQRSKLGMEEKKAKIQEILQRPGQHVTFRSPQVFDDTDVFICGSFTDWIEVPMQISSDALTYTITLPITSGIHFYRYRIEGKWEINRKEPTGVGPNGDICNKIDV